MAETNQQQHNPKKQKANNNSFLQECQLQLSQIYQVFKKSFQNQIIGKIIKKIFTQLKPTTNQQSPNKQTVPQTTPQTTKPIPTINPAQPNQQKLEKLRSRFEQRKSDNQKRQMLFAIQEQQQQNNKETETIPQITQSLKQIKNQPSPPAPQQNYTSDNYTLPPINLITTKNSEFFISPEELDQKKKIIQDTLDSFGIDAEVGNATQGPRVTLFEINIARGILVESISRLINNFAMELAAYSLRILAPVPGQNFVGLEVPNNKASIVNLGNLFAGELWKRTTATIPLPLGKSISGEDILLDLTKAPHLLIAGATGSGKSVCLNSILIALIYKFPPEQLRLILIDPKVVEFSTYNTLPHLMTPVITDSSNVVNALQWLINEMERRYKILAKVGSRNIHTFNNRPQTEEIILDENSQPIPQKLPYIVLVIDELADIMMTERNNVETNLARIAQMSRAVGIHTIIATQRPSVNVITGIIKANFPTRIAFQVTSQIDSRTIIDGKGAEQLLGSGDMLFSPPGASYLQRLQSPMITDQELEKVVQFVSKQAPQNFNLTIINSQSQTNPNNTPNQLSDEEEELIQKAIQIIITDQRASTSYLQRRLRIGYNKAATIIEILEKRNIVGPQIGTIPREILIDSPQ